MATKTEENQILAYAVKSDDGTKNRRRTNILPML